MVNFEEVVGRSLRFGVRRCTCDFFDFFFVGSFSVKCIVK